MAKGDTIPTPDDLIGPAIDAIVARRPAALRHLNNSANSRYMAGVKMWSAQSKLALGRLNDELRQRFLPTASGSGLRELVSEPDFGSLAVDEAPTKAVGEATLLRTSATAPTGVIPKGTRFRRRGNPSAVPLPIAAAEYVSTQPVIVPTGALVAVVPVECVSTGTAGNIIPEDGVDDDAGVELASTLFDTEHPIVGDIPFHVATFSAAGGSAGITDADIRRIARGQGQGQAGPTEAAIRAGVLRGTGVRHFSVLRSALVDVGVERPNTKIVIADGSWGSSPLWTRAVTQYVSDEWGGFGLLVSSGQLRNVFIRVEATVQLRSARMLTDTAAIYAAIGEAVRAYFDDREQFYLWTLPSLRSAITQAHRSILTCTSVVVKDRNGALLSEPTVDTSTALSLRHFYLMSGGLGLTFQAPA